MITSISDKSIPDLSQLRDRKDEYKTQQIQDCGEKMVVANDQILCKSYYWHYSPRPDGAKETVYVRKSVLCKLLAINRGLKEYNLGLLVQERHRPLSVQRFVQERSVYNALVKEYPGLTDLEIKSKISQFAASTDQVCPPHFSGGAVDVSLVSLGGFPVEMGKVSGLYKTAFPDALEKTKNINMDVARRNRRLLYHLALGEGMVTNPTEWWHLSYGDQMWAWITNQKSAIYGPILIS